MTGNGSLNSVLKEKKVGEKHVGFENGRFAARGAKTRPRLLASFKNKILISTFLVLIGGVILIGLILQIIVFPRLEGDPTLINRLKMIHLMASLLVIAISWVFIEMISKRITLPLRELMTRADQISREAGRKLSESLHGATHHIEEPTASMDEPSRGDEIVQLKTSFYRMLAHVKASEARLRESEEKYRFLFNNAPFPLLVLDADYMTILDVNAGAEHQYQYTRDELIGMSFWDLGVLDDSGHSYALSKKPLSNGVPGSRVYRHKRKDGSTFLMHLQARLSYWKERLAIIAAVWDVTEKLEQEAMIAQAGKMAILGEMATGIAHELNQPLNVIKLGSDFLLKSIRIGRPISEEDLSRTATELGAQVDRASGIINHLREFGRRAETTMHPMNINTSLKGVFTLLGTQLYKNGIKCELFLAEDLPPILGDENRLEQVFINLVVNAKDAMLSQEKAAGDSAKAGEKILRVKSYFENDRVVVTVTDSGPGVPPALRARIFEPFFTTKKVGEGTGLGLSISYGIIKEHNGTIDVDGAEEEGTTFRLTFPVLKESEGKSNDDDSGH
jgi:PAS domain S-box-containing protein